MNELANTKADANITILKFKVTELESQYERGLFGGVTQEEFKLIVDGTKKELKIWEYIKTKLT